MPDLLTAATRLAADLQSAGMIPDPAFIDAGVHGYILLDREGNFIGHKRQRLGQRMALVPRLPARTSGIVPSFLTGSADYWIGASGRAASCRAAQIALHENVLKGLEHPDALAVLRFLLAPPPDAELPKIGGFWGICIEGNPIHEVPAIREAWSRFYVPDVAANPYVKINMAYPMARLVSSNMDAGLGYGQTNAARIPGTGPAYADAINWLVSRRSTVRIGNSVIVGWIEGRPDIDPTPDLICDDYGNGSSCPHVRDYPGRAHFTMLALNAPARVVQRYYYSGDGALTSARIRAFRSRMLAEGGIPAGDDYRGRLAWHLALHDSPRQEPLIADIIQAVLAGHPMPKGVLGEMVRMTRRNQKNLPHRVGLISLSLDA